MNAAAVLALLPIVPSAAGGLLLLGGRHVRRLAGASAVLLTGAALIGALWALTVEPAGAWPWLRLGSDGLALSLSAAGSAGLLATLVAATALPIMIYATGFLGHDEARGRFFGFMLLFVGAMLGLVLAADLMTLLIAWELVGLCSYALIGFWYREPARARDAARAFLATRSADLGLYLAAMAAWTGGGLSFAALPDLPEPWRSVAVGGIILAAIGKSAQLPLSGWLSGAMSGPAPVSALLHSAAMVAAGVVLLLKALPLLEALPWAGALVLWVGVATALAGALIAMAQDDLKQLLAASTISQYGFMFAALGAAAGAAASAHLANHAMFKALLFLGAGVLIRHELHRLSEMGGLRRRMPLLAALLLIGALSLAAVPPFGGFFGKEKILGAVHGHQAAAFWLLLAASFLTAWYAGRIWLGAFAGPLKTSIRSHGRSPLLAAMAALALAALLGGALVLPPVKGWFEQRIAVGTALSASHLWLIALSTATVLGGLLGVAIAGARAWTFAPAAAWLGLPALLDGIGRAVLRLSRGLHLMLGRIRLAEAVARFGRNLAGGIAWNEATLLDAGPRWAAAAANLNARAAAASDRRLIDAALAQMSRALDAGAAGLLRLQSGLLHHYYAGATVGMLLLLGCSGLLLVL